jgi:hypothetical protein
MSSEEDEKKATEQLLSGFDRPGRTPRAPRARSRDFVDYYSGRDAAVKDAAPPPSKREDALMADKPTVIIPRRRNVRAIMTWVVAVVGMILFGVTIAVLATPQTPASPMVSLPPMTPTSATTITSANPQRVENAEPVTAESTTDTVITAPPQTPAKKTAPTTTITSGASSAPTIKTAPRDDFIRDL